VVKYLPPFLLFLASCACPGSGERRLDVVLRNDMDHPIELRASAGPFSRRLLLAPGEVWRGWIPLGAAVGEVRVEIAEDSRLLPAR
jgi:hypothetical protein